MTPKTNEALVRQWVSAWLNAELTPLDNLFSPNYTVNDQLVGIDGVRQAVQLFHSALSDLTIELHEIVSADDKVAVRWTVRGKQTGVFMDVPSTGSPLELTGINIHQITAGKIVANHEQTNIPEVLAQLKLKHKRDAM